MYRYILFILPVVIAGGFMSSEDSWAENPPPPPGFQYKHLSNEDIEPFLVRGVTPVVYGKGNERRKAYVKVYVHAAQKLRDVRQFLIKSEQKKSTPGLRLIDWRRFDHGSGILAVAWLDGDKTFFDCDDRGRLLSFWPVRIY